MAWLVKSEEFNGSYSYFALGAPNVESSFGFPGESASCQRLLICLSTDCSGGQELNSSPSESAIPFFVRAPSCAKSWSGYLNSVSFHSFAVTLIKLVGFEFS